MAEYQAAAQLSRARVLVTLLLAAASVSVLAALADWGIERLMFVIEGGGLLSCNFAGVDCGTFLWMVWFLPGGVVAALISACATLATLPSQQRFGNAQQKKSQRLLLAAVGPLCALHLAIALPFCMFFSSAFSPESIWPIAQLVFQWEVFAPIVVATLVGTLSFWAVLSTPWVVQPRGRAFSQQI